MTDKQAGLIGEALTKYSETHEDYWLAAAALIQIAKDSSLQNEAKQFVIGMLIGELERKGHTRSRTFTSLKHEQYINEMRELIFLTGTTAEDAAERIVAMHTQRQDADVPTDGSLLNWWNNRSEQLKLPLSVNELIYGSFEIAAEFTRFVRSGECSTETPAVDLQIKPEVKELFDSTPRSEDSQELKNDFAFIVRNPPLHPLLEIFKHKAPYADFPNLVGRFRKYFPDF